MPEQPEELGEDRLPFRDARALYFLLGECKSVGADGLCWRQLLVRGLRKIFDADFAYFADNVVVGEPESPDGWLRPTSIVDDWADPSHRELFWQFVREGRHERTPMSGMVGEKPLVVARRSDIVNDRDWYESGFFKDYVSKAGLDDWVHSVARHDDHTVQMLFLQRASDKEPFADHACVALRLLWRELADWQPTTLVGIEQSVITGMPDRIRQVLALLVAGKTIQSIAEQLGISKHTVQEHVKRLYKRTGISNRTEMIAKFSHIATVLLETEQGSDSPTDHLRRITQATKKPWPTSPPKEDD